MKIRIFEESDKQAVGSLWQKVFSEDPIHNDPLLKLNKKVGFGDGLIFVAESEEIIVGAMMAGYDGYRGWLYSIAVDETCRRKGVGEKLTKYAIEALHELGCTKVNIQVRGSNSAVVSFYEKLGFIEEDRVSMGLLLK